MATPDMVFDKGEIANSLTQIASLASKSKLATNFRLRPANERGMADHGWLRSAHSFSFAGYYDPAHIQFESLRVINDDQVSAGQGFDTHPHKNMEIFSYVLEGALSHKDSLGNGSTVRAGGIQYMSAGTGVQHSEYNPSPDNQTRFLQIWLLPNVKNEMPVYSTLDLTDADKDGQLKLILSKDGRAGSIKLKSDADIYAATLADDQKITFDIPSDNKAWVQVAMGALEVNGQTLQQGDGLAINDNGRLEFTNGVNAEFLLFDLASVS